MSYVKLLLFNIFIFSLTKYYAVFINPYVMLVSYYTCCVNAVFINVFDDWSVSATETLSEMVVTPILF